MIFKEERDKISEYFNKQEGQKYPCSNQIVLCGFVTKDDSKWKEFIRENIKDIVERGKDDFVLKNGERWHRIPISFSIPLRGYRCYKIKADKNIEERFLEQIILPCCVP